jgi:hypothetical protein
LIVFWPDFERTLLQFTLHFLLQNGATRFGIPPKISSLLLQRSEGQRQDTTAASFTLTNTARVAGADVPQVYLTEAAGEKRMRVLGLERLELAPGASRQVTVTADRRLLALFDGKAGQWRIAAGTHRVALGQSAGDLALARGAADGASVRYMKTGRKKRTRHGNTL